MNIAAISAYHIDNNQFNVTCDGRPLSLYSAVSRVCSIRGRSFGFLKKMYCFFLDLFASIGYVKRNRFEILKKKVEQLKNPERTKTLSDLQKFISRHYKKTAGTVNRLEKADIIVLGELHNQDIHRTHNGRIINQLAKEGDRLLLEYDQREYNHYSNDRSFRKGCFLPAKYVKTKIPRIGWDDRLHRWSDRSRKEMDRLVPQLKAVKKEIIKAKESRFTSERCLKDLQTKLKCLQTRFSRANYTIYRELPLRNRKMCEVINRNLKNNRRVFVIAGRGHLSPTSDGRSGEKHQKRMYMQTIESLKDKKFIFLVPVSNQKFKKSVGE